MPTAIWKAVRIASIKTQDDIEIIIKNGFNPERVKNNPRLLTETQLRSILEDIR